MALHSFAALTTDLRGCTFPGERVFPSRRNIEGEAIPPSLAAVAGAPQQSHPLRRPLPTHACPVAPLLVLESEECLWSGASADWALFSLHVVQALSNCARCVTLPCSEELYVPTQLPQLLWVRTLSLLWCFAEYGGNVFEALGCLWCRGLDLGCCCHPFSECRSLETARLYVTHTTDMPPRHCPPRQWLLSALQPQPV
jgi:hypothetical protein